MKKILVIEDEELLRNAIADLLTTEGYECFQAADGNEGLAKARETLPDLIICDVKMPGMNGHEVLKSLRKEATTSTIPFIFLSALSEKKDFRKGMDLGADDYLAKPINSNDLLHAIKTRMSRQQDFQKRLEQMGLNIASALPHELRTPLVSIVGYAQLMMEKFESEDPELFEYTRAIHNAGLRLNHLIQNFIIYSKLEVLSKASGMGIKLDVSPLLSTYSLLEPVLTRVAKRYERTDDLKVSFENAEIKISYSDYCLIIEELLDNALKFSEKGTPVLVEGKKQNDRYNIFIKDNGRGLTPEQVKNIGPYVQFNRDVYEQQGTGLGLTISRKLIEMYGGKFSIDSEYNQGTKIKISFPLNQ
ncbi:MAG: response regulator [Ignavibacteriaceae bacterium]